MLTVQVARVFQKRRASLRPAPPVVFCLTPDSPRSTSRPCLLLTHNPHLCTIILKMQLPLIRCHIHSQLYQSVFLWDNFLTGRMSSFHSAMAETSGSGVPSTKTLNIASDVNATAERYCRFCWRVPAGSLFLQLRYA